ncbi:MAG: prolipoprotein diacylglyceryl transferase, partial [Nitrospirota bacterium]|nr:prolipoprotein diacylglyceryl transferase [Nitrospirota bacterium]
MYPVLVRIGPLTIHTYGFLIASGFLVALWLAVRQAKAVGIRRDDIIDIGFYLLLAAIVGSRVFFVLTNWDYYVNNPLDIVKIWKGGLVFNGGLLFTIPTAIWYIRRKRLDFWVTADVFAPSIAIGHAIGRLGCFFAGCCYGKPAAGVFWSVTFSNPESLAMKGVPLHPVQLYEAAGEMLNFLVLIFIRKRGAFRGQLFWIYILNYSIIRLVMEMFRGDTVRGFIMPGLSIAQGISLGIAVTAITSLLILRKKQSSR